MYYEMYQDIEETFGHIYASNGTLCLAWNVRCNNVTNITPSAGKYANYTLIRVFPRSDEQLKSLIGFTDPDHQIDILKASRGFNDSTDFLVPPQKIEFLNKFITSNELHSEVKTVNYGRKLESSERSPRRRQMGNLIYQYNSHAAIESTILGLAKQYPNFVKLQNLGTTSQGKTMTLVKISKDFKANNPIIFVDAGIHAREWVAPAMALYLINRLVSDLEARNRELNGIDWYILPVVNPDGYEFTRSSPENRLWRKTMSRNGECFGVDGNRNYGFKWAVSGVSRDPCNRETFAGPRPFSEPETRIVGKIMMDNKDRIKLYVSLHAYGQYLVYPWGYTDKVMPPTWKKLDTLAHKVSKAVQKAGGMAFKVMMAGKWYPAAGGSDDYAFGAAGVPYSYTMELTDDYEFVFPEELLINTLPKFYQGFRAMADHIRDEFSRK